jgi:hypothetical protein
MHRDFVFPFYLFLIPHFTHILIHLLSDFFASYLTTTSRILPPNQLIRYPKDKSSFTEEKLYSCVFRPYFTFSYSLLSSITQAFYIYFALCTANARLEPSPRASRTTPGIKSKWIGHPSPVLSGAALISLYIFAYLPDDLLEEGLILAAASSIMDSFTYGDCLFGLDSFYVTFSLCLLLPRQLTFFTRIPRV